MLEKSIDPCFQIVNATCLTYCLNAALEMETCQTSVGLQSQCQACLQCSAPVAKPPPPPPCPKACLVAEIQKQTEK